MEGTIHPIQHFHLQLSQLLRLRESRSIPFDQFVVCICRRSIFQDHPLESLTQDGVIRREDGGVGHGLATLGYQVSPLLLVLTSVALEVWRSVCRFTRYNFAAQMRASGR